MPKKTKELTTEEKLQNNITDFFEQNRRLFFIILALIVFVILVVVIISISVNSSTNRAMIRIQSLQEKVDSFSSLDDSEKESVLFDLTKEEKSKSYVSLKASYLKGLAYYSEENWEEAYNSFMLVVSKDSSSYLAPLAIVNAASCCEMIGNIQDALDLYNRIQDYPVSGVGAKALFNIGRIYFQMGNIELSESVFTQLTDKYSTGVYASLAKNILINLSK